MTKPQNHLWMTRRKLLGVGCALTLTPRTALANTPMNISWDMLIPPGVPYSEIIGEGEMDEINDTWKPVFDSNATKLNEALDGAYIRMPGYLVPLELSAAGTTAFILVPYAGACIHTPPPPPNQLVYATVATPWPIENPWDAVWATGTLATQFKSTDIAEIGYVLEVDRMEPFEW